MDGPAVGLFVQHGVFEDWIDAFGTRAYRLRHVPSVVHETPGPRGIDPRNVLPNPSFELVGGGPDGMGGFAMVPGAGVFPDNYYTLSCRQWLDCSGVQ
jgi:hypothetical protein